MMILGARVPRTARDDVTNCDQREIAGALRDGEYTVALELRRTTWRPHAPSELDVDVSAFAEAGRPVAKDGAEFPSALRVASAADQLLAAGETIDVLVTPIRAGTLVLEVTSAGSLVISRVPVRVIHVRMRWTIALARLNAPGIDPRDVPRPAQSYCYNNHRLDGRHSGVPRDCHLPRYTLHLRMAFIRFRHKGLGRFFTEGSTTGIQSKHAHVSA